jgi:hypothetical protein
MKTQLLCKECNSKMKIWDYKYNGRGDEIIAWYCSKDEFHPYQETTILKENMLPNKLTDLLAK